MSTTNDEGQVAPAIPGEIAPAPPLLAVQQVTGGLNEPWWLTEPPKLRKKRSWPYGVVSPHRIKLAHQCMLRWASKYKDKRPDPSGPAAIVGKIVHGAYEDAAERRLAANRRGIPAAASVEELLRILEHQPAQLAAERDDAAGRITAVMFEEARGIVRDNGPVDFRHLHAIELQWTLPVSASLTLGGRIDRIDLEGDHEDPSVVTVWDYKTSQEEADEDELVYDPQATLYLVWAKSQWPRARVVRFVIRNARHGTTSKPLAWSRGLEDSALANARRAMNLWTSGDSTAVVGEHCTHCPYRDGDAKWKACPSYQAELERTKFAAQAPAGGLDKHDLPTLMRWYRSSKIAMDLHEARKSECKSAILRKLGKLTSYKHGDLSLSVTTGRIRDFDQPQLMIEQIASATGARADDLIETVLDVKVGRLDAWVEGLPEEKQPEVEAIIERFQRMASKSPTLTVRRGGSMF